MKSNSDKPVHHCGVVGAYSKKKINIPEILFYSLFSLQHRGQESAGISYRKNNHTVVYKDLGMVSTVLGRYLNKAHPSNVGIGHVRYSTHGRNKLENAQPIVVSCNKGTVALAHNGNISNANKLKRELFSEGSIFQSTTDTELMLHMISRSRRKGFHEALLDVLLLLDGAFSMVMIHEKQLFAVRDPRGFRPLFLGESEEYGHVIASETCALDILRINNHRQIEPGECVVIDKNGISSEIYAESPKKSQCIFELIYFARPDSVVFDQTVHIMRKKMGAALAECDSIDADIVIPVPDSGNSAALGYAEKAGIPFELGLTRNHYAGRSFILPTTAQRELAVRMKLHPVKEIIAGKKIVVIDDSLVRGTTSRILVNLLKESGAKEVHFRLSSPEIRFPCFYGIDIPTKQELISNSMIPDKIASYIGADTVRFIPLEKLSACVHNPEDYCFACFSGDYPCGIPQ